MSRQIAFPNPIDRTDLPKPRPTRKYALLGVSAAVLLAIVFLPQILNSRIGHAFLKARLESKCRGTIWINDFKTSWFGPTTVEKFSLLDEQGRLIKFAQLSSPISLAKLLMGRYDLGRATITNLGVEYVIDYGDGSDTFDRLAPDWAGGSPGEAGRSRISLKLPRLSGLITLKNATLILSRGEVKQDKQFRTIFRSVSFSSINGQLDIRSLDQPWSCNLSGAAGSDAQGSFTLSGTVDLGESGKLDPATAAADLKIKMQNLPNAVTQRDAPLAWVLIPFVGAEDYARMFGPRLRTIQTTLGLANGKMTLQDLRTEGQTLERRETLLIGRPTIDLISNPKRLGVAGPTSLSVDLTRGLARRLAPLHPFLNDALDGGQIDLGFSALSMPIAGNLRATSGQGLVSVRNAILASGNVAPSDAFPRELTTQWQCIVGDSGKSVRLDIPQTPFTIENGRVVTSSMACALNGLDVKLAGTADLTGALELSATIAMPQSMRDVGNAVSATINGTLDQPRLEALEPSKPLKTAMRKNLEVLAERRKEALHEMSSRSVQGMIEPLDRIDLSGQPTTRPSR